MDMLVKLYALQDDHELQQKMRDQGIIIRRPLAPEKQKVIDWVKENFSMGWQSECDMCFANSPVSVFVAVKEGKIVGFACYSSVAREFFGPTGVAKDERGQKIGTALLFAALHAMRNEGYGYAIIGGAGPQDFYMKTVGAVPIEGSEPGVYYSLMKYDAK